MTLWKPRKPNPAPQSHSAPPPFFFMHVKHIACCSSNGKRSRGGGGTHLQLGRVDNVVVTVAAAVLVVPSVGDVVAQVVQVHLEGKEAEKKQNK